MGDEADAMADWEMSAEGAERFSVTGMKRHKGITRILKGGTLTTTLCGRMNRASADGMNIADDDADVTCTLCLRRMAKIAARAA